MTKPPSEVVPFCPRCGYDQSGTSAAWSDQCPLQGTCPECGLHFEWADVFILDRKPLAWLYEHKPRRSLGLVRAWRTWGHTLIPSRFWGAVSPMHATSRAVWLWPVVLFGSLIFLGGTARAIAGCFVRYPWFPYVLTGSLAGRPPRPDGPGLLSRLFEFVYLSWCYPLWYHNYANWPRDQYLRQLIEVWAVPAATVAAATVCALTMLCLRHSRVVAAIRPAHIVRAAVYRLAPLVIFYSLFITVFILHDFRFGSQFGGWDKMLACTLVAASFVWGWTWWWTAIQRGWMMPRSRLAAALIGLIDMLTFAAVFLHMSPNFVADFTA